MTSTSKIWKVLTSILSNLKNFHSSCGSRQRDTTSSGWKFKLHNLAVKGLNIEFWSRYLHYLSLRFIGYRSIYYLHSTFNTLTVWLNMIQVQSDFFHRYTGCSTTSHNRPCAWSHAHAKALMCDKWAMQSLSHFLHIVDGGLMWPCLLIWSYDNDGSWWGKHSWMTQLTAFFHFTIGAASLMGMSYVKVSHYRFHY